LGARVDFRADIYALGVVAFELFTGVQPFRGGNAFQLGAMHVNVPPPAPSSLRPELPASLDSAILRILSKAPEERPQSASAAVRGLVEGLQGIDAAAAVSTVRIAAPAQAKRRARLGGAVAAAVLLAGSALYVARSPKTEPEAVISRVAPPPATLLPNPVPSPAPPEPAPAKEAAARVQLQIDGEPATARIFLGDVEVGQLGQPFSLPRSDAPARLGIRAPGFAPREVSIVPSRERTLSVKLRRIVRASKPELEY
jgi:hypothetical protein